MRDVHSCLMEFGVKVCFVGVTYSSKYPGPTRMKVDAINEVAKDIFDYNVKPVHSRDVEIRVGDLDGIHHDVPTIKKVVTSVVEFHLRNLNEEILSYEHLNDFSV